MKPTKRKQYILRLELDSASPATSRRESVIGNRKVMDSTTHRLIFHALATSYRECLNDLHGDPYMKRVYFSELQIRDTELFRVFNNSAIIHLRCTAYCVKER